MSYRPYQEIIRRKSRRVYVGRVPIGDGAPISVQTMTNTLTTDVAGTVAQIRRAELAGADIVRVSCPDQQSALALKAIVREVSVPIVADIHFHYKRSIEAADSGAACLRINPGNIGSQERVKEVIKAARDHGCSMRIGVNAGSLEKHLLEKYGEPNPEALVESAQYHADILQQHGWRTILLVSSPYHMRRAMLTWHGSAPDITVVPTPSRQSLFYVRDRAGASLSQMRGILQEYVAIAVYWLRGWIK